ncbi:MAG: efflux RND transporter periplasmic adaptor subunit [Flavobacteriales bacterium]|nr:efflux RND transporter periplasmic adaptor subunit [Flavobacteriales bacterium]
MTTTRILSITLFLAMSACRRESPLEEQVAGPEAANNTVTLTEAQFDQVAITTTRPERGSIGTELAVQGTIDVPPQNMVSVSAPLGGYVRSTRLLPGMEVQRGQELAILEDAAFVQLQQDYLVAKNRIALLDADAQRQTVLNASKTASDKVLQEARAALETERITLNALGEKLRFIGLDPAALAADGISRGVALRSPIHGWVSAVHVNIGKYVAPTEVLFELVDPSDIHLALEVFEKDLPLVRDGQHVHAHPTSHPEEKREAEVILVSRSLGDGHSATVHCHFIDMPKDLVPGTAMTATIETARDSAWTLPEEAVLRTSEGAVVFVVNNNRTYRMTPVTIGTIAEGMIELHDPPEDLTHAEVVVHGAHSLLMVLKNGGEE